MPKQLSWLFFYFAKDFIMNSFVFRWFFDPLHGYDEFHHSTHSWNDLFVLLNMTVENILFSMACLTGLHVPIDKACISFSCILCLVLDHSTHSTPNHAICVNSLPFPHPPLWVERIHIFRFNCNWKCTQFTAQWSLEVVCVFRKNISKSRQMPYQSEGPQSSAFSE